MLAWQEFFFRNNKFMNSKRRKILRRYGLIHNIMQGKRIIEKL